MDHGQTRRLRRPSSSHGRRTPRAWADATAATSSVASRREPQALRVGPLPSDLPDAPRGPCGETRARDARGRARRRVSTGAQHMTGRARDTRGRVTTALECSEHTMLEAVHEDASRHEHGHRMLRARNAEGHARGGATRASTAIECSEHATRKAMHAAARRERARPSNAPSARRGTPGTRWRDASEHGHRMFCARSAEGHARGRATRASTVAEHIDPAGRRSRLRECARQDRGESQAHGPRGHAQT